MVPGLCDQRDIDLDRLSIFLDPTGRRWTGASCYTYDRSTIVGETASPSTIYDNAKKLLVYIEAVSAHCDPLLFRNCELALTIECDVDGLPRRTCHLDCSRSRWLHCEAGNLIVGSL